MKQKSASRLLCSLIAVLMLFSFFPASAARAANSPFSDVNNWDYYAGEIVSMYNQGVVNGYGDGRFLPQNPVKTGEAIKLILSVAGIDYTGYTGKTSPWYSDCMEWAYSNGIAPRGIDPEAYASREEIGEYILNVYQIDFWETETDAFTDTYSQVANTLYDLGIIAGIPNGDGTVSFGGRQNVKRGDTCIMLYRLIDLLDQPDWSYVNDPDPYALLDYSHYMLARPEKLNTYDDSVNAWCWMLVNSSFNEVFTSDLSCHISEIQYIIDKIVESYNYAIFEYTEYSSFLRTWTVIADYYYDNSGNCYNISFSLSLENAQGIPNSTIAWQIPAFENACADIVASLYASGELKPSMSIKEKAYILYVYTALLLEYDTGYTNYTGYDAVFSNITVCQGYTGMYNYLCNLAGVPMGGMTGFAGGENHVWSRINSEGVWYNIDTTWADPFPDTPGYWDDSWFWLTDNEIKYSPNSRTFEIDYLDYGF